MLDGRTYEQFQNRELAWSAKSHGMRDVNFVDPNTGDYYNKIIRKVPKALLRPQKTDATLGPIVRFVFQHPTNRDCMVYTDISSYCVGWTSARFKFNTGTMDDNKKLDYYDLYLDRDYKFSVHVTRNYKEVECFDMRAEDLAQMYEESQIAYRKEHPLDPVQKGEPAVVGAKEPSPFDEVMTFDEAPIDPAIQAYAESDVIGTPVIENEDGADVDLPFSALHENASDDEDFQIGNE